MHTTTNRNKEAKSEVSIGDFKAHD